MDRHLLKCRVPDQIHILSRIRENPHFAPKTYQDDIAPESSLPGKPASAGMEILGNDLLHAIRGLILTSSPDIEIRT